MCRTCVVSDGMQILALSGKLPSCGVSGRSVALSLIRHRNGDPLVLIHDFDDMLVAPACAGELLSCLAPFCCYGLRATRGSRKTICMRVWPVTTCSLFLALFRYSRGYSVLPTSKLGSFHPLVACDEELHPLAKHYTEWYGTPDVASLITDSHCPCMSYDSRCPVDVRPRVIEGHDLRDLCEM